MCVNVCVCVSVCVGVGLSHLSFHYALRFLPVIVCVSVCAQCMVGAWWGSITRQAVLPDPVLMSSHRGQH